MASPTALYGLLGDVAHNLSEVRLLSPCHACKGTGWHNGKPCVAQPDEPIEGHDLSQCVYGLLVSPWWAGAVALDSASHVSAIAGWPGDWSYGIVEALTALRAARLRAEAREAKRAAASGRR